MTQKELVNCSFEVVDANGQPVNTLTLSNLPVQRNYRTNIYGALLTSQVDYTIEIKPGFNEPGFDHEVVDIPAGKIMMGGQLFETIGDALAAVSGTDAELMLGEGTFILPATFNALASVSIDGAGVAKVVYPEGVANIDATGAAVTLKNVTFSTPAIAGSNFPGFSNAKTETYDNVNFVDGCLAPLCEELVIRNSTFTVNPEANLDTQYKYALSFRYRNGGKVQKGTITDTEFITHMGTAVTAYNCATDLTFEGCRFTNTFSGDALKDAQSAVVYANAQATGEFKHTLVMNNCSQTGFLGHYLSDSKLWAAKTGQMLSVTIDGVEQVQPVVTTDRKNFTLHSPAALGIIAKMVNEGYWRDGVFAADRMSGCTVKLAADIDMAGVAFTPIGVNINAYPSKHFAGTFDGQGHTISNLTASDNTSNYAAAGLFGGLVGKVSNVILRDVNISSTHYAGGIAGYVDNETGSVISDCQVIGGTITSTTELVGGSWDNGDKAGGILGYGCVNKDAVTGCHVENVTIKAYRHFAPIVGYAGTPANVTGNTAANVTLVWDGTNDYKNFGTVDNVPFGEIVGNVKGALAGNTATSITLPQ